MRLTHLRAQHVRNLVPVTVDCHPDWNLLIGPNGAGKTSLLEAIYILAVGRSFRTRLIKSVIAHPEAVLSCYGEVEAPERGKIPLGIEKHRNGETLYKVNTKLCERLSDFAAILPVQLITPETFKLLTAGPSERRRFLDWGVFHVEPLMGATYHRYQQLLKQRNASLKLSRRLTAFDAALADVGEVIHDKRQHYMRAFQPFLEALLGVLVPDMACRVAYEPGWSQESPLAEALEAGFAQDQRVGFTRLGPHVADLSLQVGGYPAQQVLSRGQLKLLIFGLYLAQAQHLYESVGKRCLYLLDDLASELDSGNRQRLLGVIAEQGHQVFLTAVDHLSWGDAFAQRSHALFHVEHGQVLSRSYVKSPESSLA